MRHLEKIFWALLCGAALGAAGCGDDTVEYGPPNDAAGDGTPDMVDVASDVSEEDIIPEYGPPDGVEDVEEDEMPAGAYGPPPDM